MRREELEPDENRIAQIADAILRLNPLAVVITGGDPLFSPHLSRVMQHLSGKAGIIIDTSGYTFQARHLEMFKSFGVSVRISLDSERPKINQSQRPLHPSYKSLARSGISTAEAAVNAICACLAVGLPVTVQTVATKKNANELPSLGEKLHRLGVKAWRVFKVAPSAARMDGYRTLVGELTDDGRKRQGRDLRGPYEYVFTKIRELAQGAWKQSMAVQVTYNENPNSVVLVAPDGRFMTESNISSGKVLLDDRVPSRPSLESVRARVNMLAHAERYLNLTLP